MAPTYARKLQLRRIGGLLLTVVGLTTAGCQTFNLSEEDFERQQRGEMIDPETGNVVGVVGTVGYCGALIGEVVSAAFRK